MLNKRLLPLAPRTALVSAALAVLLASAAIAHQSTPGELSTAGDPSPGDPASPSQSPSDNSSPGDSSPGDSSPAAGKPKPLPRMGLVVPLTPPKNKPAAKLSAKSSAKPATGPSHYRNVKGTDKSQKFYAAVWGVDKLRASYTSSGNLIKFSYRVLQPKLAATLGDHENAPELVGIRSNAVLHIPTMEKIGQLRQLSAAQANKEYWMVFSNKGNLVKPGDEVSVIIGKFRADGLIVE